MKWVLRAGVCLLVVGMLCLIPFWLKLLEWDHWRSEAQIYESDQTSEQFKEADAKSEDLKPLVQAWGFSAFGGIIIGGGLLAVSGAVWLLRRSAPSARGAPSGGSAPAESGGRDEPGAAADRPRDGRYS